jgi:hypothetical protein
VIVDIVCTTLRSCVTIFILDADKLSDVRGFDVTAVGSDVVLGRVVFVVDIREVVGDSGHRVCRVCYAVVVFLCCPELGLGQVAVAWGAVGILEVTRVSDGRKYNFTMIH